MFALTRESTQNIKIRNVIVIIPDMSVHNLLNISDEQFLARSIRNWREALVRGDAHGFCYWAVHAFSFARDMKRNTGGNA